MTNPNETISYRIGKGIVDGARAMKNINPKEYLENDWKKTKNNFKNLSCKLSYPILGNLSASLQERIENKLGKEYYNSIDAFKTSAITNIFGYAITDYLIFGNGLTAYFAGCIGVGEAGMRIERMGKNEKSVASLPGKLASLPLEAILGVYDGIRGRK